MLPHKISSLLFLLHGNMKENPKVVLKKKKKKKKENPVLFKENMHITFVSKNAQCRLTPRITEQYMWASCMVTLVYTKTLPTDDMLLIHDQMYMHTKNVSAHQRILLYMTIMHISYDHLIRPKYV